MLRKVGPVALLKGMIIWEERIEAQPTLQLAQASSGTAVIARGSDTIISEVGPLQHNSAGRPSAMDKVVKLLLEEATSTWMFAADGCIQTLDGRLVTCRSTMRCYICAGVAPALPGFTLFFCRWRRAWLLESGFLQGKQKQIRLQGVSFSSQCVTRICIYIYIYI